MFKQQPWIVNKEELFVQQAPSFNFELNVIQLLEKALKDGYVTFYQKIGNIDYYEINQEYGSEAVE